MLTEHPVTSDDTPYFTFTCISTGGPATTVTWTRDSDIITDGATQTMLDDRVTAQYTHTLTVSGRPIGGVYLCNVSNSKPSTAVANLSLSGTYYNS